MHDNLLIVYPGIGSPLQALFVTFLWSTSWVLTKFGLQDTSVTFAGLRYTWLSCVSCRLPCKEIAGSFIVAAH
jgi:drug/metabolite transporter (DMT)-like permease